jgi:hypothetical protein
MTPSELAEIVEPVAGVIPIEYCDQPLLAQLGRDTTRPWVKSPGIWMGADLAELVIEAALQRRIIELCGGVEIAYDEDASPTPFDVCWMDQSGRTRCESGATVLHALVAANVAIQEQDDAD